MRPEISSTRDSRSPTCLARNPRFIVLVPGYPADGWIFEDPSFKSRYRGLFSVDQRFNWSPPSAYKLYVFERL